MNWFKKLFCWMSWHSFGYNLIETYDNDPQGIATTYKCKWCEFKGLVDSQGNLF